MRKELNLNEEKYYDNIIEKFVKKYRDGNEDVILKDGEYHMPVLIKGIEYHGHWMAKDKSRIEINNFMIDYKAIIELKYDFEDNKLFKEDDKYIQMYKEFELNLKNIGVTIYEKCSDGYDVLMVYSIPTEKILDDTFIDTFDKILSSYSNEFEEELKLIYK